MSPKMSGFKRLGLVVSWFLLTAIASYLAYAVGINRALGNSAYVNATMIRLEEQRCIRSNDMECMMAAWRMRAELTAASARRSNEGFGANPVEKELAEYIRWVEVLPPREHHKK